MNQRFQIEPERLEAEISRLPTMSVTAASLLDSLKSEEVELDYLTRLISTDQGLVARLLRVANSPFYGMAGKIHGIHDAIVVLGLRGVSSLAMAVSLSNSLPPLGNQLETRQFWKHSLLVAICARELGKAANLDTELAFAAGLLHDVGRLVIASGFPEAYAQLIALQRSTDTAFHLVEQEVLVTDHARIGALLASKWRFPEPLIEAIRDHHALRSEPAHKLAQLVHVADALAHALDLVQDPNESAPEIDETAWRAIIKTDTELDTILPGIILQFENVSELVSA